MANSSSGQSNDRVLILGSMLVLLFLGVVMVMFGIKFISMKKQNPDLPDKIYAPAVLSIVLGFIEVLVAAILIFKNW